ncbi:MAG: acyl-CoA dehydrogenase family protein [Microthrixaceae bacterium]
MIKWSDEQEMVRQAVRDFIDTEIRPHRGRLEFGDLPPYDLLRKMLRTFGMDAMAQALASPSESNVSGAPGRHG